MRILFFDVKVKLIPEVEYIFDTDENFSDSKWVAKSEKNVALND